MRYPEYARALIAGGVMHNYQQAEFIGYIQQMHVQSPDQWRTVLQQTVGMWSVYPSLTR